MLSLCEWNFCDIIQCSSCAMKCHPRRKQFYASNTVCPELRALLMTKFRIGPKKRAWLGIEPRTSPIRKTLRVNHTSRPPRRLKGLFFSASQSLCHMNNIMLRTFQIEITFGRVMKGINGVRQWRALIERPGSS